MEKKIFETEETDAIEVREYKHTIELVDNGFECVEMLRDDIPAFIEFLKQFMEQPTTALP